LAKKQFFSSLFFLFGTLEMGVFKLILTGLDLPFIVVNI